MKAESAHLSAACLRRDDAAEVERYRETRVPTYADTPGISYVLRFRADQGTALERHGPFTSRSEAVYRALCRHSNRATVKHQYGNPRSFDPGVREGLNDG